MLGIITFAPLKRAVIRPFGSIVSIAVVAGMFISPSINRVKAITFNAILKLSGFNFPARGVSG